MVFIYGYATQLYLNVEKLRHKMPTATIDINGRLNGDNLHITLKIDTLAQRIEDFCKAKFNRIYSLAEPSADKTAE